MKKKIKNLFYLFFPLVIGGIVAFLMKDKIDYNQLIQPKFAPPAYLFPIVWTIIYFLMGLSFYYFNKNVALAKDKITGIYYTQLFFNATWSIIFFIFKMRLFAIVWIIILDVLVISLIYNYLKRWKISAYVNIPYLIWILFATYLNIGIYLLN